MGRRKKKNILLAQIAALKKRRDKKLQAISDALEGENDDDDTNETEDPQQGNFNSSVDQNLALIEPKIEVVDYEEYFQEFPGHEDGMMETMDGETAFATSDLLAESSRFQNCEMDFEDVKQEFVEESFSNEMTYPFQICSTILNPSRNDEQTIKKTPFCLICNDNIERFANSARKLKKFLDKNIICSKFSLKGLSTTKDAVKFLLGMTSLPENVIKKLENLKLGPDKQPVWEYIGLCSICRTIMQNAITTGKEIEGLREKIAKLDATLTESKEKMGKVFSTLKKSVAVKDPEIGSVDETQKKNLLRIVGQIRLKIKVAKPKDCIPPNTTVNSHPKQSIELQISKSNTRRVRRAISSPKVGHSSKKKSCGTEGEKYPCGICDYILDTPLEAEQHRRFIHPSKELKGKSGPKIKIVELAKPITNLDDDNSLAGDECVYFPSDNDDYDGIEPEELNPLSPVTNDLEELPSTSTATAVPVKKSRPNAPKKMRNRALIVKEKSKRQITTTGRKRGRPKKQQEIQSEEQSHNQSIRRHWVKRHNFSPPPKPCPHADCPFKFQYNPERKVFKGYYSHLIHYHGVKVQCPHCPLQTVKQHLKRHIKNVHERATQPQPRNHICTVCDKGFVNNAKLNLHLAIHSDDRPFLCGLCGKTFKTPNTLYIHGWSHDPDRRTKYSPYMKKPKKPKKAETTEDSVNVNTTETETNASQENSQENQEIPQDQPLEQEQSHQSESVPIIEDHVNLNFTL